MIPSLRYLRYRRPFLLGVLFTLVLFYPLFLSSYTVKRLLSSHSYNLNHAGIFRDQFQVYILTHSCDRFTSSIASNFNPESVILVPDVQDSPACAALGHEQFHIEPLAVKSDRAEDNADDTYRSKYAQALWHCRNGEKMKCLFLEDDIVLLHNPGRTREVLVEQTLSLFNRENNAYDCTKRGWGWIPSTHTGNGSQCRIYSKTSAECMVYCLSQNPHKQLDYGLGVCQSWCRLDQKRFLLAVHSGLSSTMGRTNSTWS